MYIPIRKLPSTLGSNSNKNDSKDAYVSVDVRRELLWVVIVEGDHPLDGRVGVDVGPAITEVAAAVTRMRRAPTTNAFIWQGKITALVNHYIALSQVGQRTLFPRKPDISNGNGWWWKTVSQLFFIDPIICFPSLVHPSPHSPFFKRPNSYSL